MWWQSRNRHRRNIGPAKDARSTLVFGIAATQGDADRVGQVIGEIGEDRPGAGIDITEGLGIEASQNSVEQDVEYGRGIGVEHVIAHHAGEAFAFIEDLEFLGRLLIGVDGRNVQIAFGKIVEVDRGR
jgi:hypothetical protein